MLNGDMKNINRKEMNWNAKLRKSDRHVDSVSADGVRRSALLYEPEDPLLCPLPLVLHLQMVSPRIVGLSFPSDGPLTWLFCNPTLYLQSLLSVHITV